MNLRFKKIQVNNNVMLVFTSNFFFFKFLISNSFSGLRKMYGELIFLTVYSDATRTAWPAKGSRRRVWSNEHACAWVHRWEHARVRGCEHVWVPRCEHAWAWMKIHDQPNEHQIEEKSSRNIKSVEIIMKSLYVSRGGRKAVNLDVRKTSFRIKKILFYSVGKCKLHVHWCYR